VLSFEVPVFLLGSDLSTSLNLNIVCKVYVIHFSAQQQDFDLHVFYNSVSGTVEQEGRTQMQNIKINRFIPKKSKSQQSWKKLKTRKCTRKLTKLNYAKTWEETWVTTRQQQQGVYGVNDGE